MKKRFQGMPGGGRRPAAKPETAKTKAKAPTEKPIKPAEKIQRNALPIPDRQPIGLTNWVQIDLGEDAKDADHFINPEERMRLMMALQ